VNPALGVAGLLDRVDLGPQVIGAEIVGCDAEAS
jgi:hypothetical protein